MRAVLTVVGTDKKGIIASVATALSKFNVNIEDISQTVLQEYFTMIMIVDISEATIPLLALQEEMKKCGEAAGVDIKLLHEDIFNCMHKL